MVPTVDVHTAELTVLLGKRGEAALDPLALSEAYQRPPGTPSGAPANVSQVYRELAAAIGSGRDQRVVDPGDRRQRLGALTVGNQNRGDVDLRLDLRAVMTPDPWAGHHESAAPDAVSRSMRTAPGGGLSGVWAVTDARGGRRWRRSRQRAARSALIG